MRALAVILCAGLAGAGAGACASSMDKHIAASKADGKPLVVEFYTSWCGACRAFDRSVLPDPTVERALRDVSFVRYDAEHGAGRAQAKRYGVRAFPTFLVIDGEGNAVAMIRGLPTASRFVSFLEWGPVHGLSEEAITAKLAVDASTRTLLLAARYYASVGALAKAVVYYDRALAALDDPTRLPDVGWERTLIASAGGELRPLAEAALAYATAHPRAAHMLDALGLAVVSGALTDDEARALSRHLVTALADDAAALNDIAYTLLAGSVLDVALEAATAQLGLVPDEASAHDTLAEVHHYRGERELALAAADKAIELAPSFSQRAIFEQNRRRFADTVHRGTSEVGAIVDKTKLLLADLRIRGATER